MLDPLVYRLDLLLIVLDAADAGRDVVSADHVLRAAHRYRVPVAMDGDNVGGGGAGGGVWSVEGSLGDNDEDDDCTSHVGVRSAQAVHAASAAAALDGAPDVPRKRRIGW